MCPYDGRPLFWHARARSYDARRKLRCAPPPPRAMGDAEAPPLLAAQALLLEARGRDLIVFNPGVRRHGCALHAQGCRSDAGLRAGSTYVRVGRASDAAPVEVPHVAAFPWRGAAVCPPRRRRAGAAAARRARIDLVWPLRGGRQGVRALRGGRGA